MKPTFTIAVVAGNGIGGTEKAAVLFAVELAKRGHRLIFVTVPGPRDQTLKQGNVRQLAPPKNASGLAELFKTERVDVVHQHMPGYPINNPIYDALQILGDQRPRLIETNVFGRLEDPAGDKWIDFRGFISRSSAVQAFQRSQIALNSESLRNMTVLFYPLPPLDPATQQRHQREEIRKELGIGQEEILIVRFGRPGKKWTRSEVIAFQLARKQNPLLRMLLMEPEADIWHEVESGRWGEGILLQRATSDFERLAAIYTAGDMMLHMPDFGESYGYTLAEAMQQGLPLIANSTPWCDNAQVELVEHGVTGFICNSSGGAANAVLKLARDPKLREEFGAAAVKKIDSLSNLTHETDLLEEILNHVVHGAPLRGIVERNLDLMKFKTSFAAREKKNLESESSELRFSRWKGASYTAYRQFRGGVGQFKRRLQGYRTAST
jgi:glycosyltransferase involved in cell wall biosynthesis